MASSSSSSSFAYRNEIDDERHCRNCLSQNLRVDWAQGDRVCTDCGVVDESHLLDDRPEWRDFGDAEDLVKGLPSGARSGLVAVDETRYPGGLQPTSLSKQPFGNPLPTSAHLRKALNATNRRMDRYMEMEQKKALKGAKLSLLLKRKHIAIEEHGMCPEYDVQALQSEEDAHLAHVALHQEKWSLERAILLHEDDQAGVESSSAVHHHEERLALASRLDKTLKRASSDLYMAYTILQQAAQRLDLTPHIIQHATHTLCKYASTNDGFTVKGVASRLSTSTATSKDALLSTTATEKLRDYNRLKQMAALASALLFLEARKHGHVRSLHDVCASFQDPFQDTADVTSERRESFLKIKHCNKAMKALRIVFPEYMSAAVIPEKEESVDNFIENATRKLDLPPVATASIQVLVGKIRHDTKLPLAGAAVTLLVCMAGTIMQRLARQAMQPNKSEKRQKTTDDADIQSAKAPQFELEKGDAGLKKQANQGATTGFDLFLTPAIADPSYEMRQMWDAWVEQMPWSRSVVSLEHAFKISRHLVLDLFKTKLYPQRFELLSVLQESVELRATPRAKVLLSQMSIASPLLNCQGKV